MFCAALACLAAVGPLPASVPKDPPATPASKTTGASPARPEKPALSDAQKRAAKKVADLMKEAAALSSKGDDAAAEMKLGEAYTLAPNYGPLLGQLAELRQKLGRTDQALSALEQLIRIGEPFDDRSYIVAAQIFAGRGAYADGEKRLIEWAGDRRVSANFHAAIGILRMGTYDMATAETAFRSALDQEPANLSALKGMFQIYDRFDRQDLFQPFLDKALTVKPTSTSLRMLSGSNLMRQKKFAEARKQFEEIVKTEPRSADAWVNLGSAVYSLGGREEGMADFRKAIDLDPRGVQAPINLSTALQEGGANAEARDVLLAARKRGIASLDLLNALAVAHAKNGEYDAALAVANESLKREPGQGPLKKFIEQVEKDRARGSAAR
jgi:tetratricopeptide (TPR) repeat protein